MAARIETMHALRSELPRLRMHRRSAARCICALVLGLITGCGQAPPEESGSDILGGVLDAGGGSGGSVGSGSVRPADASGDPVSCTDCPTDNRPVPLGPLTPPAPGPLAPPSGYPIGTRTPQWPLKTQRRLYSEEQMVQARMLTSTHPDAIVLKNNIVASADYWLSVPDEQLFFVLPDQRVPRAVDVSASSDGCPVHGTAVFSYGTYPWILNKEYPYRVTCPVGNESYPSNDFSAYLASGMQNSALLTGSYPDNGYGYQAGDGRKYWFVAYAVHWHWRNTWVPACTKLAQAYALTGDRRYARKAIVMLDRIASSYPAMNYRTQSRDSLMGSARPGKIVNSFWESLSIRDLAVAYDLIYETLIGQNRISLPWRTPLQIRQNIEANLLEEGMDAYDNIDIDGNYGTHQSALAHIAVVRDCQQARDRMVDKVFRATAVDARYEGFDYALRNLIFKDGLPYETSPFYNGYWVTNFAQIAEIVPKAGIDVFAYERMSRIFDAPLDLLCAQQFTPSNGDSGDIYSLEMLPHVDAYETAYRALHRPAYAWTLNERGALTDSAYNTFNKLFVENIDIAAVADASSYSHVRSSRALDGYGMAVLNNDSDSVAVSMYYGIRGNHGHKDRLNLEMFAHGSRVSPDLGYPDFANSTTPGRFAWTSNTISHNTVCVNGLPQDGNDHGNVLRFHHGRDVQVFDVDASTSYLATNKYRRTLVMVEVGSDAYLVDVFRVAGGESHVLSLHGAEGAFALNGAALSAVNAQGTLAGTTVGIGQNSGQPVGPPNYNSFYSGNSFFYNWQNVTPNVVTTAEWSHLDGSTLRAHIAPNSNQEIVVADARVSPLLKIPAIFKYVLLRRNADANGTTFVTVWELAASPIITGPVVVSGEGALGVGADRTVVVSVPRGSITDTISISPQPGTDHTIEGGITSDAAVAVFERTGSTWGRTFVAGGSHLTGDQAVNVPATLIGTISSVNYSTKTLSADTGDTTVDPASLVGKTVRIRNELHSSIYRIGAAQRSGSVLTLTLGDSEVFTGRIKILDIITPNNHVLTYTSTLYPDSMPGMYLVTEDLTHAARIESNASYQRFFMAANTNMAPFQSAKANGQDLWIADFGAGDTMEIERFAETGN